MTILSILTALLASEWSTTCVMTQADGLQGYVIDSVLFQKESKLETKSNVLNVTFNRVWFNDENCSEPKGVKSSTQGEVSIGSKITEGTFEADWTLNKKLQLGLISVDSNERSLRMTTTSFGNNRNTMLSLFKYFAD